MTENGKRDGDAQQVKSMLEQIESPIDKFIGDDAYNTYEVRNLKSSLKSPKNEFLGMERCHLLARKWR